MHILLASFFPADYVLLLVAIRTGDRVPHRAPDLSCHEEAPCPPIAACYAHARRIRRHLQPR